MQVVGHKQLPHAPPHPSQEPSSSPEQQHTQGPPSCTPSQPLFHSQSNATLVSTGHAEQCMGSIQRPALDQSCSSPAQSIVNANENMPHGYGADMPHTPDATSPWQLRATSNPDTAVEHNNPCGAVAQPLRDVCASGHVNALACVTLGDGETCKAHSLQSPLLATAQTALGPRTPPQLQHSLPVRVQTAPFAAAAAGILVKSHTRSTPADGMLNLQHQAAASQCESTLGELSDGTSGLVCQTANHADHPSSQTMDAAVNGRGLLPVGITTYTEVSQQQQFT